MTAATPLSRISREELPQQFAVAWDTLNELTEQPTFVEVFAQAPHLLNFVMGDFYQNLFFGGEVAERYKQLGRLRLSVLHGCLTCNKQNVPGAKQAGFSDDQIAAIVDPDHAATDSPLSEADLAVLALADEIALTNLGGNLSETLHKSLSAHFSDAEICELGVVMGVISGLAKMSFVFNVVDREDYCPFQ